MQKLENLEITKVAFVPEGDNKKANVLLFKSKDGAAGGAPHEGETGNTDAEVSTMKRVLLAIGKALGFEHGETNNAGEGGEQQQNNEGENTDGNKTQKGVEVEVKIDKSKLTAEELAQLEAIEKKAGVEETGETTPTGENAPEGNVGKGTTENTSAGSEGGNEGSNSNGTDGGDIYKGLHPEVAAELKKLREMATAIEDREMLSVAKKYEILGKKPEELAKTLKTLKNAGGTAYDDMIGVLDASLTTVEKSGAFSEIGKSGHGGSDSDEAWANIEKHAAEILKASPTLSYAEAVDKACEQHPELVAEYENNR